MPGFSVREEWAAKSTVAVRTVHAQCAMRASGLVRGTKALAMNPNQLPPNQAGPDQAPSNPYQPPSNPYQPPTPGYVLPGQQIVLTPEMAATLASIQKLQRVSQVLRFTAIGLIVLSLVAAHSLPGPILALLFLARIVAWLACGILALVVGRKVATLGQPAGQHYISAAIYLAVVVYLVVLTFQH